MALGIWGEVCLRGEKIEIGKWKIGKRGKGKK